MKMKWTAEDCLLFEREKTSLHGGVGPSATLAIVLRVPVLVRVLDFASGERQCKCSRRVRQRYRYKVLRRRATPMQFRFDGNALFHEGCVVPSQLYQVVSFALLDLDVGWLRLRCIGHCDVRKWRSRNAFCLLNIFSFHE